MTTHAHTGPQWVVAPLLNASGKLLRRLLLVLMFGVGLAGIAGTAAADEPAARAVPVNINEADAQTLAEGLQGVGLARAEEIVRYREAFGPFVAIDELADVKGIGPATVDKNRAVLTLD